MRSSPITTAITPKASTGVGFRFQFQFQFVVAVIVSLFFASFTVRAFSAARRNNSRNYNNYLVSSTTCGGFRINQRRPHDDDSSSSAIFAGTCLSSSDSVEQNNNIDTQRQTPVWKRLSDWFQGDFDNYAQVVEDREQNLEPREGGGHEHFHCTLVPVMESTRLAAFFFDGNPDRIFRFRYYELMSPAASDNDNDNEVEAVEMMLNTLHPDLEKLLKSHATDPLSWPDIFENFQPADKEDPKVTPLTKCEISWSFEKDPVQHSYASDIPEDDDDASSSKSLHAVMVHGPTVVDSTTFPGMQIRIIDQLSLYRDVFYINDRGFNPMTGAFIYGNQREVPYRLERVSTILSTTSDSTTASSSSSSSDGALQRQVINPELEWTIGPNNRTPEEYESKLNVIGGPSAGINKKNYKSGGPGKKS